MKGLFGITYIEESKSFSPNMLSWKTLQHTLATDFRKFSENWPKSGMMRNGHVYPLVILALPTKGKDSFVLLPTPRASDAYGAGKHGDGGMDLRTVIKFENLDKYGLAIQRWAGNFMAAPNPLYIGPRGGRRINPDFAEWMMGFPQEWTKGISYKQRMKCIGNSVMQQHAEYVLYRLLEDATI